MKSPNDLQTFYDTTLKTQIDALEQRRRRALNGCFITAGIVVAAAIVIAAMTIPTGEPVFFALILIGGVGVVVAAYVLFTSGYRRDFKNTIVRGVIEFMEPNLRYYPDQGISSRQFQQSELFKQRIDRYRCEDLVQGRIGQTDVAFSEVHAQYKTSSGSGKNRRTHWHTIFKGVFFIGDFHKDFHGRTVVLPDRAEKLLGRFGQTLQGWNIARGQLVKLEDIEFEREFVVYSDDQIEARYILSPGMMERIVALKRKLNTDISLSFFGSRVYAAFSMRDNLFEPKLLGATDLETLLEYVSELRLATDIVEDLNLNTRIWSKA